MRNCLPFPALRTTDEHLDFCSTASGISFWRHSHQHHLTNALHLSETIVQQDSPPA